MNKHPLYTLGKHRPRKDKRTFQLTNLLRRSLKTPPEYSFDTEHPGIPLQMLGNDNYGDCVEVAKYNQQLRFEYLEQKHILNVTAKQVVQEYFKETGGDDTGLIILDSLNLWRNRGLRIGKKNYKIKAYAQVSPTATAHIKQAIYTDVGINVGLWLPMSAAYELDAGKPWTQTRGKDSKIGSWGGHCVFIVGYTTIGPVCLTWGQRQAMSWKWFRKYCDEAYAVIDALDTAKKTCLFDSDKLDEHLNSI